ncbi:hypothetical protein [Nocardioides sp. GXZ039]|uniref:hypothetical protein n=1 Tax=Nocardioides sp. GXZ039 TaxID=3136018 RepID=UPI0030F44978
MPGKSGSTPMLSESGAAGRRRVLVAALVLAALVVAGLWMALGRGDDASAGPPPDAQDSATPSQDTTSEGTAVQPDPRAPRAIGPVKRPGEARTSRDQLLRAPGAEFGAPAAYPDGVSVRILGHTNRHVNGLGPGATSGPATMFRISVANDSESPLELGSVVVTAVYGPGAGFVADPSYDLPVGDLAGTLRPGATRTAKYAFAIPADARDRIRLYVDLDGSRMPAVFTGSIES